VLWQKIANAADGPPNDGDDDFQPLSRCRIRITHTDSAVRMRRCASYSLIRCNFTRMLLTAILAPTYTTASKEALDTRTAGCLPAHLSTLIQNS
jgi:hypothetical protein